MIQKWVWALENCFRTCSGAKECLIELKNMYLRSPEWGGPKGEKRDGTGKCYRWLAKGDLMTKTGYSYAKCLTVAGTATLYMLLFRLSSLWDG